MKIAKAMHDIEWVDSGDTAAGSEIPAILECITNQDLLKFLIIEGESIRDELKILLRRIKERTR